MLSRTIIGFLFILLSMIPLACAQASDYQLGPNDVVSISVWGYEDLQVKELIIRSDGNISFPLVGEVKAEGKTPAALSQELMKALVPFVIDPKVTVNVVKPRTTRVYVLGEIQKPGMYELEKSHTLLDAISIAQGYTKDAAKKKVVILKQGKAQQPIHANLLNIIEKGDLSQNYELQEGDVVYLSSNGRIDLARDILPYLSAIYYARNIID